MNRKGFTMVELLASVAILGILSGLAITGVSAILNKAHEEYYNSERKNLVLAAQAYYNANKTKLPKVIGKKEQVTAGELKANNYLKSDITTYDKKEVCDESYVRVFKYGQSEYSYTAYLICGTNSEVYDDPTSEGPTFEAPVIEGQKNVALSAIKLKMHGGTQAAPLKLISYSYVISIVKGNRNVELINSGNKAYSSTVLEKNLSLSKYTLGKETKMIVKMRATNINGTTKAKSYLVNFEDNDNPKCILREDKKDTPNTIEGKKAWVNDKRTITIECDDVDGSGCEKKSYTKTFTKDNIVDTITIKDNAGNSVDCEVTTYIDKTKPVVEAKAYQCKKGTTTADTTKLVDTKKFTADGTWSSSEFDNHVNGWLNNANYPNGVCFVFSVTDNMALKSTSWKWNTANQKYNNTGYKTLTGGPTADNGLNDGQYLTKKFVKSKTYKYSLTAQGHRYAEFNVIDDRGNSTTIKMDIKIDRKSPSDPKVSGYKKPNGNNLESESGLRGYTFDQWYKGWVLTKGHSSTDEISGLEGYYITTSGQSTDLNNKKQVYRNINVEEKSVTIKYRTKDVAGNWSNYVTRIVRLDRKAHSCTFETATSECDTDGVNVKINCSDPGKGLKKCAGVNKTGASAQVSKTNITGTTPYTVEDDLGNTATCSFTIHADTQYKKRSCADCLECSAAGCGQCTKCTYQSGTFTWSCDTDTQGDSCGSGHASWCTYLGRGAGRGSARNSVISYSCPNYVTRRNCSQCGCNYYNTSCASCGCNSWNGWSNSWSVGNACSSSKKRDNKCDDKSRVVYRHKSSSCP